MRTTARPLTCAACIALVAAVGPAIAQGRGVRDLPAREVPLPSHVSPELREIIAAPVPPLGRTPATPEEWKRAQAAADTPMAKLAEQAAAQLGVRIEEVEVAGVRCYRLTPAEIAPAKRDALLVHVHGGAYVFNAGLAAIPEGVLLAAACKMPVLSVDYRMPPDHPYPAAPDDVLAVWKDVLEHHDPARVVMGGTSAGGGLAMVTTLRCDEEGLAKPAALFLGTPGADLTKTGDSMHINAEADHMLGRYEGRMQACIGLYADGVDLRDPHLSPLYGDLSGFPPTVLITGTRDLLLSATASTHRKLRAAGITAELHVYEGMSHADYLRAFATPEGLDALGEVVQFFDRYLVADGPDEG